MKKLAKLSPSTFLKFDKLKLAATKGAFHREKLGKFNKNSEHLVPTPALQLNDGLEYKQDLAFPAPGLEGAQQASFSKTCNYLL